jgi:hypothetical protein
MAWKFDAGGLFGRVIMTFTDQFAALVVKERPFSSYALGEWDNFAASCCGSFLGSWGVLKVRRLFRRIKLFDFLAIEASGHGRKIGQCAVGVKHGNITFLDSIQICEAQKDLRDQCLKKIIERFGAANYHYGSHWNAEHPVDFSHIPHFIANRQVFHLDLIDFSQWTSFAEYRRSVSENIRRDYKRAKEADVTFKMRFGLSALPYLFALVAMRGHMARKNRLRFSWAGDYLLHLAKLLVLGKNGMIASSWARGECFAAFFGARVSERLYYISGGTRMNRIGAGAYLFLRLIENWFSKHPNGKFWMGDCLRPCDWPVHESGNLLYRRKLRVQSVNGVKFQLMPKRRLAGVGEEQSTPIK